MEWPNDNSEGKNQHGDLWRMATQTIQECSRSPMPDVQLIQVLTTAAEFLRSAHDHEELVRVRLLIDAIPGVALSDLNAAISIILDHDAGPDAAQLFFEHFEMQPPMYVFIESLQEIVSIDELDSGEPKGADEVVADAVRAATESMNSFDPGPDIASDLRDLQQLLLELGRVPTRDELLKWAGFDELADSLVKSLTSGNLSAFIAYLEKSATFCEQNGRHPTNDEVPCPL